LWRHPTAAARSDTATTTASAVAQPSAAAFEPAAELQIDDLETVKLLADPLRLRIMESFGRIGGGALTVKRIAAELGESATKLYYHVNLLEERGLLKAVGSRIVSGIVETSYLPAARSFKLGRPLFSMDSPDVRETLAATVLTVLDGTREDILATARAGLVDLRPEAAPGHKVVVAKLSASFTPKRVEAFTRKLHALVAEMDRDDEGADVLQHGLTVCFYPLAVATSGDGTDER
jgi:DNA-binding transcriptional ArsR family regulator